MHDYIYFSAGMNLQKVCKKYQQSNNLRISDKSLIKSTHKKLSNKETKLQEKFLQLLEFFMSFFYFLIYKKWKYNVNKDYKRKQICFRDNNDINARTQTVKKGTTTATRMTRWSTNSTKTTNPAHNYTKGVLHSKSDTSAEIKKYKVSKL